MNKGIKRVYLSAILQDCGKTTMSLGLLKAFIERKLKPAFIKPVGQKYVEVGAARVDKDSYLVNKIYRCSRSVPDMSPVTVGRGFTEDYIMRPDPSDLRRKILDSFGRVIEGRDIAVIEGTGHAGVGSVFDCSNADVAKLLGAKVIIVSEGGIGKSIDEIVLNKALFDKCGVETLGVIINKVMPDKFEKIARVVEKGLANKGIKLLGVIPFDPILTYPTMEQVRNYLGLDVLCGKEYLSKKIENVIVATMEPQNIISYFKDNMLMITSGDRIDNILVAVSVHKHRRSPSSYSVSGIILTGGMIPHVAIAELLKNSKIPVLLSNQDTYSLSSKIKGLTIKIEQSDKQKIDEARRLVKEYVNVDAILEGLNS